MFWARLDANAAGGPGTAACRVALNDITAHKQDEEALRFANTVLSTQSEASIDGILVVDAAGTIISFNRRFIDIWGISPEVIASKSDERALRSMLDKLADPEEFLARVKHLYAHREEKSREEIALLDNRFLDRHSAPMLGNDGRYCGRVWYFRDITGRKRAEAEREEIRGRLLQAQKMDAVGVLAGGVAHDFNNILTVARSYAEFIYKALPPESPMRADAQEILTAADRAAAVTRQLLAFSRKQMLSPRVTDINTLVVNMTKMLKRLLGEDIELTASLAPVPCQVMADPGQIEQMIMNLVVNTRDALPKGGTVTLETALVTAPEMFTALPGLSGGPVVRLRVRDNGCGMPEEVKRHIFEPFYTTKAPGKGTGLGLATVFGIVKQSGGEIDVESEAGKGTVFSVYLPLIEAAAPDSAGAGHGHAAAQGHETVLLVEDDETLRRLGERLLKENGYAVIAVSGGQAALEAMERHGKPVDLLLSDVIMPGMNGRDLALELQRRKLAGRVLYMSGYTNAALARHGVLEPGIAFIYKPFTADALAAKLREALDGPADKAKA